MSKVTKRNWKGIPFITVNYQNSNLWIYSGIQQPNKYYKYTRTKRSSENKKLVFLSKKVLELVSTNVDTTGTIVRITDLKDFTDC